TRQAADAEGNVEPERAGRDRLDLDGLVVLPEAHDRAFAKGTLDLCQRGIEGFRLVHGTTFYESQCGLGHGKCPYCTGSEKFSMRADANVPVLFPFTSSFFVHCAMACAAGSGALSKRRAKAKMARRSPGPA